MALPSGEAESLFADGGVDAVGKVVDELRLCGRQCLMHGGLQRFVAVFGARAGQLVALAAECCPQQDVLFDGRGEEGGVVEG